MTGRRRPFQLGAAIGLAAALALGGGATVSLSDQARAQLGPVPGDGGIRRGPQGTSSQSEEVRRRFEALRARERERQRQTEQLRLEGTTPPQTTLQQELGAVLREDQPPGESEQGASQTPPPAAESGQEGAGGQEETGGQERSTPAPSAEETEAALGATTPPPPSGPQGGGLREGDPLLTARRDLGDRIETAPTTIGAGAVLRGLDKFTGERVTLTLSLDESGVFQRMRVEVRACYARASARNTEASAFVQVYDDGQEPPLEIFSGWMFSTSPALSAVDHPRFDFWVLSCTTS